MNTHRTQSSRTEAIRMAELYDGMAEGLIEEYGTGVRPAWVSTEISIAKDQAAKYWARADSAKE